MSAPPTDAAATRTSTGLPSALVVVGLLVLFVGQRVLGEGSAATVVSLAGVACVAAAFALKLLAQRSAAGHVRRVETLLLGAYGGVVAALVLFALSTDWAMGKLGLEGSAADRTAGSFGALYPAVLVVALATLLFLELAYRRMPIVASVETRRVQAALETGLTIGFAVVFLASVNYVAEKRDVKRDLSYFKTSRPSETTLALARRLEAPLRVYLFYPETSEVLAQLRPYFQELSGASSKVRVAVRDHALVPKLARKHRVAGNGWVLLVKGEGDGEQAERFEIGAELEDARSRLRTLDERFQQAFNKLTVPPRTLSLTAGHGERTASGEESDAPGDRTTGVAEILRRFNITTQRLGIAQGLATGVPEDTRAVAILGPRERFLPEEAEALARYVRSGGRLVLMIDPDTETGLGPLLSALGLELARGKLTSERRYVPRTRTLADRTIVHSNVYSAHPIVGTLQRHSSEAATIFIEGGALVRREGTPPGGGPTPQVTFPVRSTAEFWRDLDGDHERDDGEPFEALNMVAAVSFPAQGSTPEGRAVVIADGDFVADKVIENAGNLLLFVDALRWLVGEEQVQSDLTSEEDVRIEHTRDEDKIWFYATSFGVPLPLLALGLWIGRRRRARAEGKR